MSNPAAMRPGVPETIALAGDHTIELAVNVAAGGMTWVLFE